MGWNGKCPPQVHVSNCWFPAGGAISEASRNLRGRTWVEACPWRSSWAPVPSVCCGELLSTCCSYAVLARQGLAMWYITGSCPLTCALPHKRTKSSILRSASHLHPREPNTGAWLLNRKADRWKWQEPRIGREGGFPDGLLQTVRQCESRRSLFLYHG